MSTVLARFSLNTIVTTKKTSNLIISSERGPRCPGCHLPRREVCPICKRSKVGKQAILPSERYRLFEKGVIPQLRVARPKGGMILCWVNVEAHFYRAKNIGDAVGYYQALADAMEAAEFIKNDRQIRSWNGSTLEVAIHPSKTRIDVVVTRLEEEMADLFSEEDES